MSNTATQAFSTSQQAQEQFHAFLESQIDEFTQAIDIRAEELTKAAKGGSSQSEKLGVQVAALSQGLYELKKAQKEDTPFGEFCANQINVVLLNAAWHAGDVGISFRTKVETLCAVELLKHAKKTIFFLQHNGHITLSSFAEMALSRF